MKNGDMPATPVDRCNSDAIEAGIQVFSGLTKREMFCLHMGIAETWDAELDDIIRKGNKQKMAAHMMASIITGAITSGTATEEEDAPVVAKAAIFSVDALLAELDKTGDK